VSSQGYIYVRNWERFQHYKTRRPPWIKMYVDLLGNDEWLSLRPSDVKLLCALWMLAGVHGNGRVRADEKWLKEQAKAPRSSLKSLSDAGFIEVRASKALAQRYHDASTLASATAPPETETETEVREEPIDVSRNRSRRAHATVAKDQQLNGQTQPLPALLCKILDPAILDALKPAQAALVTQAWETNDVEIRHSLAAVEAADNPTAYLISVCRRLLPSKEPSDAKPRQSVNWPKGVPSG
jgi:hypothetical protein